MLEANGECGITTAKGAHFTTSNIITRKRREPSKQFIGNMKNKKDILMRKRSTRALPLISSKPTRFPLIVMGQPTSYPGQIPWQALLSSNAMISKSPFAREPLGDFCGGTYKLRNFYIL